MTTDRLPKSWVYETAHGSASVYGRPKSRKWLKQRLERGRILVDTETDGVSHDRKLRLVQVGWSDRCYLIDPGEHPKVVRRIMDSEPRSSPTTQHSTCCRWHCGDGRQTTTAPVTGWWISGTASSTR